MAFLVHLSPVRHTGVLNRKRPGHSIKLEQIKAPFLKEAFYMASIYKRGKTWTASVSVPINGVYKKKTKSGFTTKSEANKWAIESESQKNKQQTAY